MAAIVGFTSSFAIVLAGLGAVGADSEPTSSGLLILSVSMGLTGIVLCWRSRMPLSIAWSTPGAALLIGAGPTFIATSPPLLIEAVAGLALLGALGAALTAATADPDRRDAALVTFVVTASQITAVGLSVPFWG